MATISCDYYSLARHGAQSFTAILPCDPPPLDGGPVKYVDGPYPTIYLLHGFSGNRHDWLYRSNIEMWAVTNGYAVIMPDGTNRFYLDNEDTEELYGTYVGQELVEMTRRMFPLSRKREDTVIAGLSMGGFGAVRNGLHYADTFGAIIALSSALITEEVAAMKPGDRNPMAPYGYYRHTFGDPEKLLGSDKDPKHLAQQRLAEGRAPRMFVACGTEDFLWKVNEGFHNYMDDIGYPHEWWAEPGAHDFDFWNRAMRTAIQWLSFE